MHCYNYTLSGYNSTIEKQKLQNVMAFGVDTEPKPVHRASSTVAPEQEVDRFDEILQEIGERKEFLNEMESLGQGQKFRNRIMTEISQVLQCIIIHRYM